MHLFIRNMCASLVAPYNVTITGDNTYDNGSQLELTCLSKGGRDLEYSWSRTNLFSANTNTNTATLTIDNVATVDGGDYTCAVSNDVGMNSCTITVYGEFTSMCTVKICNFLVCFLDKSSFVINLCAGA